METCKKEKQEQESKNVDNNAIERGYNYFHTKKKGGWITFPFIIGTVMGLSLSTTSWSANLVVYAIEQYQMNEITAAKLYIIATGGITFVSIITAILADYKLGSFVIFIVASFISLLGAILFTLSSLVRSLRPHPCTTSTLVKCNKYSPSHQQGFFYSTIALAIIGAGGTNSVLATIGAYQFPKSSENNQRVFFNWFIVAHQLGEVIGYTIIVYLQNNVSWGLGFGIGAIANTMAIIAFLFGSFFYLSVVPESGNPFTSIARVVVASIKKRHINVPQESDSKSYFYGASISNSTYYIPLSNSLRFFNRAALKTTYDDDDDDNNNNETTTQKFKKSWTLCTIQEVEDFKSLVRVLPILSAGLISSSIFAIGTSLAIIQALAMDRTIGPHFKVPPGSMFVVILITTCIGVSILDRIIYPSMQKMFNWSITPLQCIGVGYFMNLLSTLAFALVEKKRLEILKGHQLMNQQANLVAPMSVFWLVIPLGFLGLGSAFYFSTLMRFYYQELPNSLKNTTLAIFNLQLSMGSYIGTGILSVVQHTTSWLSNDINHGHVDKLYWMLFVIGLVGYVYFLICAKFYKYNNNDIQSL